MLYSDLPANKGSILHGAAIIDLQVIKVTVIMIFQVEGVKRQPNQVAWVNTDEPGTVGTMWVAGGVARACNGAWRTG